MGLPNAGKSTLVNRLVGRKVAGVSAKPQTTRRAILGVRNEPACQMIFVDTPGLGAAQGRLGGAMAKVASAHGRDADVTLYVVDASAPESAASVTRNAGHREKPTLLILNKIDRVPKPDLLPLMASLGGAAAFVETVPVCASTGDGIPLLLDLVRARLPEGPRWYAEDPAVEGTPDASLVQEVVQEAIFARLRQEVPYGCAVLVERVERDGALLRAEAAVLVERDAHKGIVIGRGGSMLKDIGTAARVELEKLSGGKVFLGLRVKVEEDWRNREAVLRDLGYVGRELAGGDGGDV